MKISNSFIYVIAAFLVSITLILSCCTLVDSAEVGIKFKKFSLTEQGKLDATNVAGYVFYNPFTTDVFTYPTYVQIIDCPSIKITTNDQINFTADPTVHYQLDRNRVVDIFAKYRTSINELQEQVVLTYIVNAYRLVANKYSADGLTANRNSFEEDVRCVLDSTMGKEGFIIGEFTSNIDPPKSLQESIDSKAKAVQAALRAENEVLEAEAKAKIAIATAEGDAKAMKIKADAEAYYNRTIAASLTHNIVLEDWIEKWDGKMPQIQGNSNMMPMINFSH